MDVIFSALSIVVGVGVLLFRRQFAHLQGESERDLHTPQTSPAWRRAVLAIIGVAFIAGGVAAFIAG